MILTFITSMLPYMLITLPAFLAWRYLRADTFRKRGVKTTVCHEAGIVVFALFLVGLASLTILPDSSGLTFSDFNISISPLKVFTIAYRDYFYNNSWDYFFVSFLGNILMFVPVGFFIPLLNGTGFYGTCLCGFLCSLFIEIVQLPLSRWSDIDDLWLNTLGTVIGCVIYALLNRCLPKLTVKFKISI